MAKSKDPAPDSLAETRKQIEQTRGELAETVEALAAKADVKARASAKAGEVKAEVVANPTPLYAAAAGLVALVALVIARKRRKGKKK